MDRMTNSSEALLARINRELEHISDVQHRLARKRLVLQEQATRLRLGAPPQQVRTALKAAAAADQAQHRLPTSWEGGTTERGALAAIEGYGRRVL